MYLLSWALSPCCFRERVHRLTVYTLFEGTSFYAGFFTALLSVFALSFTLVAVLIFWRRSNDWMAMLVSVALVSFGTSWTDVPDSLVTANPEWRFAGTFLFALGLTTLFLLFYLFPDGRFVPRWTRFAAFLWIAVSVALFVDSVLAQEIYGEGPAGQGAIGSLLLVVTVVVVLIGVYAQIYRYTRHSTPVQRQQSKWVMVGLTTAVLLGAVGISLGETVLSSPGMPDGRIGLVVGDVTDKGVPAALVMATTRAILRAAAEQLISPGEVLQRANDVLCPDIPPKMFVTCLYAILDPAQGQLQYANAGQDLPCHMSSEGIRELRATGMPLGLMPGMTYEQKEVWLKPGESVLMYSDGLVEAHNDQR